MLISSTNTNIYVIIDISISNNIISIPIVHFLYCENTRHDNTTHSTSTRQDYNILVIAYIYIILLMHWTLATHDTNAQQTAKARAQDKIIV